MSANLIAQLDRIFYPRSVAVIGASNDERKFGRDFLDSFIQAGFPTIYPINPHEKTILGLKAYPSVKDVPAAVDYALVATPTSTVLQVVSDCAEKGVAGVSIYTSGFREKGPAGQELERRVVEAARRGTQPLDPLRRVPRLVTPEGRRPRDGGPRPAGGT